MRKKGFLQHKKRNSTLMKKGFTFLKNWTEKKKKKGFLPSQFPNFRKKRIVFKMEKRSNRSRGKTC